MPYLRHQWPTDFRKQRKHFVSELAETKGLLPDTVLDTGLQMLAVHLLGLVHWWTQRKAKTH